MTTAAADNATPPIMEVTSITPDDAAPVSEEASEKSPRRRGRPPAFDEEYLSFVQKLFPEAKSRRGLVDIAYRLRAIKVLKDEPDCRWLCDIEAMKRGGDDAARKPSILTELGRIEDPAALVAVAKHLCDVQPTTEEAIRMVHHWRVAPPKPREGQLAEDLVSAINRHLARYPGTTHDGILDALAVASALVAAARAEQNDAAN